VLAMPAPPSAESYTGPQACHAAGITYRQLDYWARTDLVVPSIRAARGSGTQRRYSHADVIALAIISCLLAAGLSLQSVRRSIDKIRGLDPDDLDGRCLALTDRGARLLTAPELVEMFAEGGVFHVLPLGHLVDEVDAALDAFDAARQARADRNAGWDFHPTL
jgi:DNA-binding transcriptional MerR regulator